MAQETGYTLTLKPQKSDVPADVRFRRLLKSALRTFEFRCVDMRYDSLQGKDAAMVTFMNAHQCAELIVNGLVGWCGPRADIAVDPRPGDRYLALAGDGTMERSVELASELRKRLITAITKELTAFAAEHTNKAPEKHPVQAAGGGQTHRTAVKLG